MKKKRMINKKAGAFAVGMVLAVIVLMGFTWHGFVTANRKIDAGISSLENLSAVYDASDRLSLYLEEAALLSAQQGFYSIAQESAVERTELCFFRSYEGKEILLWSEDCKPEQAFIEQRFLFEHNKSLNAFLARYPETINATVLNSLENGGLITSAKGTLTAQQAAAYASYNLSSDFNQSFRINLTEQQLYLADFEDIYNKVKGAVGECKGEDKIESCIKGKLDFERWNCDVKLVGTWLLFECSTKKRFFFEDGGHGEQFRELDLFFGITL